MYVELRELGLAVVTVDISNNREGTARFFREGGFALPTVFDDEEVALTSYRIAGTPTTYLLDARGRIVWRRFGYFPGDEVALRRRLLELLAD